MKPAMMSVFLETFAEVSSRLGHCEAELEAERIRSQDAEKALRDATTHNLNACRSRRSPSDNAKLIASVLIEAMSGNKINAIKLIRGITDCSLLEARDALLLAFPPAAEKDQAHDADRISPLDFAVG